MSVWTSLLPAVLMCVVACGVERRPAVSNVTVESPWSSSEAVSVLTRAVGSQDEALRAEAWSLWIGSGDSSVSSVLMRAVMDPSPLVQRTLAKRHADRVGSALAARSRLDPVAAAWLVLRGHTVPTPQDELWATLFSALEGEPVAQASLIETLSDDLGVVEPGIVEVLGASNIVGMAPALLTSSSQAEPLLAGEMRLAALRLGDEVAAEELLDPDAPTLLAGWAIEVAVRHPSAPAVKQLRRVAQSSGHPLNLHARLGLMAIGEGDEAVGLEGLRHPDRDTRAWAATCLRRGGRDRSSHRDKIALLQGSTRDESSRVRVEAVKTLVALAGVDSVPLRPPALGQELDLAAVIVAAEWLAHQS